MEASSPAPARQCASCQRSFPDLHAFELVCYCNKNHGICCECFVRDCPQPQDRVDIMRSFGWKVMGGEHALYRRVAQQEPPTFTSLALQDPAFLNAIDAFMQGRSMPQGIPYVVYVPPPQPPVKKPKSALAQLLELTFMILLIYFIVR